MVAVQSIANVTCIDTVHLSSKVRDTDKVIVGDSFGNIMTMEINVNDLSSNNTKPDLMDPSKRVIDLEALKRLFVKKHVHDEAVTKLKYIKELSCFISCSISEKVSLVIEDLRKFETKDVRINRQVSVNKGLNTFCYCSQANILATGGKDKYIRLYNPLILGKTIGKLPGHLFTIVDLACNEKDQQLISLSAERVFRVWDLSTFKCLQVYIGLFIGQFI
jgi:WD40 repeat protein